MKKHHEKAKSETTTWLTPLPLIEALGQFDLDPCGFPGHDTAHAMLYQPADGLKEPWFGRVWLNPPYGKGIDTWLFRLWGAGHGTALVPARTETQWFQAAVKQASGVLFLEKRISFLRPEGNQLVPVDNNTVGSVLLSYGLYDREMLRRSGLAGWFVSQ